MGQVDIITREQETILDLFSKDPYFSSNFYFTGGTALAYFHYRHRQSIDLDFFNPNRFSIKQVDDRISDWSRKIGFKIELRNVEDLYTYWLTFKSGRKLKVDFTSYPYERLEKGKKVNGIDVDSKHDIAVNKMKSVVGRSEVKDFVDLYFLLQKDYTLWDLIEGVRAKFNMEIDPLCLGTDLLMVNDFEYLPKMAKPLTLQKLRKFFLEKIPEVTGKSVV